MTSEEKIKLEPLKIIHFSSNSYYFGSTKNQKLAGIGILKNKRNEIYIGEFLESKYDGLGILKRNQEEEIIGEFNENSLDGIAKITQNRYTYIGEIAKNQIYGVGEIVTKNGMRHRGIFNQGILHGYGEIFNPKVDSRVSGYFVKGVLQGEGKEMFGDLIFYGNFKDGYKNGKGIIVQNNRCVFKGNWKKGQKNGFCHYELSPLHYFDGMVEVDKRQGSGKLTDKGNSKVYTGEYVDDLKHGFGRLETKEFLYIGEWFKGKKQGLGYQKNYPSKDADDLYSKGDGSMSYFGFWRNGLRHGVGYETTPTREIKGEFYNGVHHGKAIIKSKVRKGNVYALFDQGVLVEEISKRDCRRLFQTSLDIELFFKESKHRITSIETFIEDQKLKLYFNHREVKFRIDEDQINLQHCLDRINLHYLRIRNGVLDLKSKISKSSFHSKKSKKFVKTCIFEILPERFDEEIQLDHIYFNAEGDMRFMLENCKHGSHFEISNSCLHNKFNKDVDYEEEDDFSNFWVLRHPWLVKDTERYSMIIDRDLENITLTKRQAKRKIIDVGDLDWDYHKLGEIEYEKEVHKSNFIFFPRFIDGTGKTRHAIEIQKKLLNRALETDSSNSKEKISYLSISDKRAMMAKEPNEGINMSPKKLKGRNRVGDYKSLDGIKKIPEIPINSLIKQKPFLKNSNDFNYSPDKSVHLSDPLKTTKVFFQKKDSMLETPRSMLRVSQEDMEMERIQMEFEIEKDMIRTRKLEEKFQRSKEKERRDFLERERIWLELEREKLEKKKDRVDLLRKEASYNQIKAEFMLEEAEIKRIEHDELSEKKQRDWEMKMLESQQMGNEHQRRLENQISEFRVELDRVKREKEEILQKVKEIDSGLKDTTQRKKLNDTQDMQLPGNSSALDMIKGSQNFDSYINAAYPSDRLDQNKNNHLAQVNTPNHFNQGNDVNRAHSGVEEALTTNKTDRNLPNRRQINPKKSASEPVFDNEKTKRNQVNVNRAEEPKNLVNSTRKITPKKDNFNKISGRTMNSGSQVPSSLYTISPKKSSMDIMDRIEELDKRAKLSSNKTSKSHPLDISQGFKTPEKKPKNHPNKNPLGRNEFTKPIQEVPESEENIQTPRKATTISPIVRLKIPPSPSIRNGPLSFHPTPSTIKRESPSPRPISPTLSNISDKSRIEIQHEDYETPANPKPVSQNLQPSRIPKEETKTRMSSEKKSRLWKIMKYSFILISLEKVKIHQTLNEKGKLAPEDEERLEILNSIQPKEYIPTMKDMMRVAEIEGGHLKKMLEEFQKQVEKKEQKLKSKMKEVEKYKKEVEEEKLKYKVEQNIMKANLMMEEDRKEQVLLSREKDLEYERDRIRKEKEQLLRERRNIQRERLNMKKKTEMLKKTLNEVAGKEKAREMVKIVEDIHKEPEFEDEASNELMFTIEKIKKSPIPFTKIHKVEISRASGKIIIGGNGLHLLKESNGLFVLDRRDENLKCSVCLMKETDTQDVLYLESKTNSMILVDENYKRLKTLKGNSTQSDYDYLKNTVYYKQQNRLLWLIGKKDIGILNIKKLKNTLIKNFFGEVSSNSLLPVTAIYNKPKKWVVALSIDVGTKKSKFYFLRKLQKVTTRDLIQVCELDWASCMDRTSDKNHLIIPGIQTKLRKKKRQDTITMTKVCLVEVAEAKIDFKCDKEITYYCRKPGVFCIKTIDEENRFFVGLHGGVLLMQVSKFFKKFQVVIYVKLTHVEVNDLDFNHGRLFTVGRKDCFVTTVTFLGRKMHLDLEGNSIQTLKSRYVSSAEDESSM